MFFEGWDVWLAAAGDQDHDANIRILKEFLPLRDIAATLQMFVVTQKVVDKILTKIFDGSLSH